ncbi:MAG: efflux RND transporter periplasmic adaptor subunit [Candidatus Rokubacteria bacterium]|nr:efflux RND transporter periplasmic adaptor subunit [Candidatus Rokubacteria bacterium]
MSPGIACLLVGLLVVSTGCNRSKAEGPPPAGKPAGKPDAAAPRGAEARAIPVTVARAETRKVQRSVETSGSLLAWDEVQAKTEQPGTIARLHVDLGDRVAAGTPLADYDRREFQLAVDQAQADLGAARESLARAHANVAAAEAQLRRMRDTLATLDAEVARAQSQHEWATSEMERTRQLFARELIAARDVDSARNQQNIAAAQLTAARLAVTQHPDQVRAADAQREADLAGVKTAAAQVRQREALLGIAHKRLGDTTVRASLAGVVAKRHISAGEYVKENTALFTLVVANPLKYVGTVPERQAPDLQTGQTVRLQVEAYPGKTFTGSVLRIAPAVEVATRTLVLEARVPNGDGTLRPGFFAKGEVLTLEAANVVFVPAEAVTYVAGLSKVFVVADGKVQERLVKPGARQGGWLEIGSGVSAGEPVAVTNLAALYDGAAVGVAPKR